MPQNYKQMTEEQFETLMHRIHTDADCMGEESVYACTASPYDHFHTRRLGDKKGGDNSRVGVMVHSETGVTTLFFSAADARSIAETLLTLAEEIDGVEMSYDVPDDLTALMDSLEEPDEDDIDN